ncbi:hypothetical protein CK203_040426 [Vitis vinifera]|uniref:Uncharacterized protein n=1 Tax=Vitis vinifera TaxID=29760 RepID=A0A438I861_VITVI|nr:hypothetical protein CK203_040426 [Vitis vinifera]
MYIRGRGKIGYLIGDTKEATKTDLSYAAWDAENSMIMTRLVKCSLECVVRKTGGMLCLGRSSLDLWKTQPYWALQQRLLAILITNVVRMTSQEFGVIIAINHATLMKLVGNYMGSQLIGKPVEWKTNKQSDSNCFLAKAHVAETPSLSKEQLDQLLQLLKLASPTLGTPIASLAQSGFELGDDDWQC